MTFGSLIARILPRGEISNVEDKKKAYGSTGVVRTDPYTQTDHTVPFRVRSSDETLPGTIERNPSVPGSDISGRLAGLLLRLWGGLRPGVL